MRAMILAAGKGTRLRPLTETTPKPLLDVAGQPMIAYPLQRLREAGIQEAVINLHHLGSQIRAALGSGEGYGVRLSYSEEDPILDTGGGIAACRDFLGGDTFVVLNADTYIEVHLTDVIAFHRAHAATVTLVLRHDPHVTRYGVIEVDASQRVRRFLGHPAGPASAGQAPVTDPLTPLMYAGVMILEPRVFTYLHPGIYSITRHALPRLLQAGEPLFGFLYDGYWRVLDTPADLAEGRREIAARLTGHHHRSR
jgi:NDP-sugar pyrophosphorylase family protein